MKVLVVEDEPLLAMLLEESLAELGHEVAGSAATVEQAMATLDAGEVDFALLDYTLADETNAGPVAERLRRVAIPFIYMTGHRSLPLGSSLPEAPMLAKPFTLDQLDDALKLAA
jgi:DNA-binding response OmpR family regulator